MSGAKLKELLESFQEDILKGVDSRLQNLNPVYLNNNSLQCDTFDVPDVIPTFVNGKYLAFLYAEGDSTTRKFWQVPKNFIFPKCDQRNGWRFWMLGMPDNQEKPTP